MSKMGITGIVSIAIITVLLNTLLGLYDKPVPEAFPYWILIGLLISILITICTEIDEWRKSRK